MPLLEACTACGAHRRLSAGPCPHCGAAPGRAGARASTMLLGLVLAGCPLGTGETGKETGSDTGGDTGETSTCGPSKEQPEYGVYGDDDEDGFFSWEDCNDADPAVNPCAEEVAGDGIDADCDGDPDE